MAVEGERRVPLSRERVLETALRLADEGGIESLSMRKLGHALGVEAMSLYNHVASKDDLLGGMVDLVVSQIALPSAKDGWEVALRRFSISAHDALVRHRWASTLLMSMPGASKARLRYIHSVLQCLREAGFSPEATYHAYHTIDSHILGFTLWQLGHSMPVPGASARIRNREELIAFMAATFPTLRLDDYPYLVEHAEQHFSDGSHKDVTEFEFGLELILDGLKRMPGAP